MVKIVHCLGWYFPDSVGGSEVYVNGLTAELSALGLVNEIVAPLNGYRERSYVHEGTLVFRYPCHPDPCPAQIRGDEPHGGFDRFADWLRSSGADVFHLHSWTYGSGLHHLKLARSLGLRTVVTVHVPEVICLRGTMMEHGSTACDGVQEDVRCGTCWLEERGIPRPAARAVAGFPDTAAGWIDHHLRPSRLGTMLTARRHAARHAGRLRDLVEKSDAVIAVCQWLFDALSSNGVPAGKLHLIRQGIRKMPGPASQTGKRAEKLRIAYFGRLVPVKGVDVLLKAFALLPKDLPVCLSIHAATSASASTRYADDLHRLAGGDSRIEFLPPVSPDGVMQAMRSYDLVAVPSVGLETGPLVVMEALSAGVPVLGSRLGGIAELVRDGKNGTLCEHRRVKEWSKKIGMLATNHERQSFSRQPTWDRTYRDVARETAAVYSLTS